MSEAAPKPARDALTLFLSGDVMLGRGVDQILPHPGNPTLYERQVADARTYVDLAIRANGSIPQPVDWSWPWGDALQLLAHSSCDARIVNLETSITTSDDYVPGKAVHYRMNPANSEALAAVRPDACVLANNHVLDFGRRGLLETLDVLSSVWARRRRCRTITARGSIASDHADPEDRGTDPGLRLRFAVQRHPVRVGGH